MLPRSAREPRLSGSHHRRSARRDLRHRQMARTVPVRCRAPRARAEGPPPWWPLPGAAVVCPPEAWHMTELRAGAPVYALLMDGTQIQVRELGPADLDAVRDLHQGMSPESLY